MSDFLRDAPLGQVVRFLTGNRVFQYPEEHPDFRLPEAYNTALNSDDHGVRDEKDEAARTTNTRQSSVDAKEADMEDLRKHVTTRSIKEGDLSGRVSFHRTKTREETQPYSEERLEIEAELAIERTKTIPIAPTKTADGKVLVEWYTTDDPANPQNWSNSKRFLITLIICLYTFAVYTGSAIYTSGEQGVIEEFHVSETDASLPLSLYVLAYGMGKSFFSRNTIIVLPQSSKTVRRTDGLEACNLFLPISLSSITGCHADSRR